MAGNPDMKGYSIFQLTSPLYWVRAILARYRICSGEGSVIGSANVDRCNLK